tara:strand:- start:439 stop:618 length:180 start_codon:yes stop_codon:yes gene_type:complete
MSYDEAIFNTMLTILGILIVVAVIGVIIFEPMAIIVGANRLLVILLIVYAVMKACNYRK